MYKNKNNIYHIPIKFNPKYQLILIITTIYLNIFVIFSYSILFQKDILLVLVMPIILLPLFFTLYLDLDLISSIILNKQYVEINYDGIIIKKLFKEIKLKWDEIYIAEMYSLRMANTIRITREKDLRVNKYLRIFGTWFGLFYIDINHNKYKNIDIRKFINTIAVHIRL